VFVLTPTLGAQEFRAHARRSARQHEAAALVTPDSFVARGGGQHFHVRYLGHVGSVVR